LKSAGLIITHAIAAGLFLSSVTANASVLNFGKPQNVPATTLSHDQLLQLADYRDGVLSHKFVGMGRCSQVMPTMQEIAHTQCRSVGRGWCDERPKGVTIAYIVCKK
jgi:hypothetical protein